VSPLPGRFPIANGPPTPPCYGAWKPPPHATGNWRRRTASFAKPSPSRSGNDAPPTCQAAPATRRERNLPPSSDPADERVENTIHHTSHQVSSPRVTRAQDNARIPATFVYAGIDLETSELLAGVRGAQIAGRFTLVPTRPFPYGAEWKGLVATMEETLRLHKHPPRSLVKLDRYLHNRTDGMIGALSHAIRGAAIDAILGGTERVSKEGLAAIPLDHTAETTRKPLRKAAAR
jgi:hypothetical protein